MVSAAWSQPPPVNVPSWLPSSYAPSYDGAKGPGPFGALERSLMSYFGHADSNDFMAQCRPQGEQHSNQKGYVCQFSGAFFPKADGAWKKCVLHMADTAKATGILLP